MGRLLVVQVVVTMGMFMTVSVGMLVGVAVCHSVVRMLMCMTVRMLMGVYFDVGLIVIFQMHCNAPFDKLGEL